ncbi:hypothetical protein LTR86_008632 [Recurvomyces mirabilis]|nr:hypothetical protein LTR86_008632 [Recurvomyces mirabilis]
MAQHVLRDSALSISSTTPDAVKIKELEDENKRLLEMCNAATQHYADYENDIHILKAQVRQAQRRNDSLGSNGSAGDASTAGTVSERPGLSRFGSFMHSRKASPTANGLGQASAAREEELRAELAKERNTRLEAENKAKEAHDEIEELSATLFEQANEMVASERKENARLVERVQMLEQQVLCAQQGRDGSVDTSMETAKLQERLHELKSRDAERNRRLEILEAAIWRVERVNDMLLPR